MVVLFLSDILASLQVEPSGLAGARRVHDHHHAQEAQGGAEQVEAVWTETIDEDAPGEGPGDEDAAVGGQDPPEVRVGLECRDEPVDAQRDDPGADEQQAAVSRTPCQTSQAPPISASAATANSMRERSTVMVVTVAWCEGRQGMRGGSGWSPLLDRFPGSPSPLGRVAWQAAACLPASSKEPICGQAVADERLRASADATD
jgi:hypothetical protein